MTQTRLQYIDYLPPLAPYELGLSISSNDISLRFDFLLFFKPFNMFSWITIFVSTTVIAIAKSLILESNRFLYKSVAYIWTGTFRHYHYQRILQANSVCNFALWSNILDMLLCFLNI